MAFAIGDIVTHFKGNVYVITSVSKFVDSEHPILCYEYQDIETGEKYTRTKDNFEQMLVRPNYTGPRFKKKDTVNPNITHTE